MANNDRRPAALHMTPQLARRAFWRARSVLLRSGMAWEEVRAMAPNDAILAATSLLRAA